MKIHFMKDEALNYFRANIDSNLMNYLNEDNSWIYEKYAEFKGGNEEPFAEFKLEVGDIKLDMSNEKPERTDVNNAKILYLALKNISDTQASDERFWAGLAHSDLWQFMKYRSKINESNIDEQKIKSNFFFGTTQKRSLIVHPLAKLWWVGRLTYNEEELDPFRALNYLRVDFSTKVLTLFSSNFTNNPVIARAILNAVSTLETSVNKFSREDFFEILRYVNFLGGIIILDYLSQDELEGKIIKHYNELHKFDTL